MASLLIILFATLTLKLFCIIPWDALIWPDQQRPVERCWNKRNPVYNTVILREAELNIKEDHLCRWTTFSTKKRCNYMYVSTRLKLGFFDQGCRESAAVEVTRPERPRFGGQGCQESFAVAILATLYQAAFSL